MSTGSPMTGQKPGCGLPVGRTTAAAPAAGTVAVAGVVALHPAVKAGSTRMGRTPAHVIADRSIKRVLQGLWIPRNTRKHSETPRDDRGIPQSQGFASEVNSK